MARALQEAAQEVTSRAHTLDDLWPLLEALEELAGPASSSPALGREYARAYAALAASSEATSLRAALCWGINELLERGEGSQETGRLAALGMLGIRDDESIPAILAMLGELRPETFRSLRLSEHPRLRSAQGSRSLRAFRANVDRVSKELSAVLGDPRATISAVVTPGVRELLEDVRQANPVSGVLGLGALKATLTRALRTIAPTPKARRSEIVRAICDSIFEPISGRPDWSAFLHVEAAEAIRDSFPGDCAHAMGALIGAADDRVQQGFVVCIAEGYEEHFRGRLQSNVPRFRRVHGTLRLEHAPQHPNFGPFAQAIATLDAKDRRVGVLAAWFNRRMENWLKQSSMDKTPDLRQRRD
jgi:hypothetical protein